MSRPIYYANASDADWTTGRFLFSFGAYGDTYVMAFANDMGDALEHAAEKLVELEFWGHITPHEKVTSTEDLGCDCADPHECDSHTYTESGWLTSFEWHVRDDPSVELRREIINHSRVRGYH